MALHVLSAVMFYPRGGSAHAARALARGLRSEGYIVTLVAGSTALFGGHGDAHRFYGDVHAVDFDPALASQAPLRYDGPAGTAPMHPSFEDRPGAPDAVFASLDDLDFERQVRAWARELEQAGAASADVAHLHHLTPVNEAMARVAPGVPIVGQLHGTELLMLERIGAGAPEGWTHAERWAERLRTWAARCARLLVTPSSVERAVRLLGVPSERVVPLASGVDVEVFSRREVDRAAFWHQVLVEEPAGWLPGEEAGTVDYAAEDVRRLAAGTILLSVGRFTAVKRIDRLIAAFGRAHAKAAGPAGLVLVGGHPGEWEGEHPAEIADRLSVPDVFLAGWHDHEDLPAFFSAADLTVTSSEREQFGLVLVEGMACGLPVVAVRSPGPELIVDDGITGWLVAPEDESALATAMLEAIEAPEERRRRGRAAADAARGQYSWSAVSAKLAGILAEVAGDGRHAPAVPA